MIKYKAENKDNILSLVFIPLIFDKDKEFKINKPLNKLGAWPIMFYTATTDMRDFIGNITQIDNGKCAIKGVYRGQMAEMKGVFIKEDKIKRIGQRVMVTEHLNVNGQLELIATIKRIINITDSNLNFVNIGWSDEKDCEYLRIDIYTGESKTLNGDSIPKPKKG